MSDDWKPSHHKIEPASLPKPEEDAQRAGRVGMHLMQGLFESIYRMGYEAGLKAAKEGEPCKKP